MKKIEPSLTYNSNALYSRIENVIDFAIDNIKQLDVKAPIWSESIAPDITLADKVAIETALLLLISNRNTALPQYIKKKLKVLGEELNPHIRCKRSKILLMKNPQAAAVFGIGHVALNEIGMTDTEFDILVKRPFLSGEIYNTERLPYRTMDVLWLRNLILPNTLVSLENILPHTTIMSKAHPVYMTTPDIYALTHSLMYATDFGINTLSDQIDSESLSETVNSAIAYHLLSDNLDILGELLMSASMLQKTHTLPVRIAWKLFDVIWEKLDFLPCPTFDSTDFKTLSGKEASSYAFKHLYHTTYVGGILLNMLMMKTSGDAIDAATIQPGKNLTGFKRIIEEIEITIDRADLFTTKIFNHSIKNTINTKINNTSKAVKSKDTFIFIKSRIHKYFSDKGVSKYVLKFMENGTGSSSESMYPILLESFLIHAIQDYNMVLLIDTLKHIAYSKLPVSQTVLKSVEFIIGQQVPNGAIGIYFVDEKNLKSPDAFHITTEIAFSLSILKKYLKDSLQIKQLIEY